MLLEAAYRPGPPRPPIDEALADLRIARYIESWGRPGDAALIAVDEAGRPIGAGWYRVFRREEPGFGFIDGATPEISIAVVPDRRSQGIGSALLGSLVDRAREEGFQALTLSVSPENPAVRLYERCGFVRVPSRDDQWTMRLDLKNEAQTY
jgi:GNAT superfamily N-acetyltransferase